MNLTSVIVCCYNDGSFVRRALESIYDQTVSDDRYEVVFVDDGSTDGTGKVVEPYRERPNFRYIRNRINMGLAYSCNRGLDSARGQYIVRLDADDTFEPRLIESMAARLDDGTTDFVYSDRYERDEKSGELRRVSLGELDIFRLIAAGTMMRRNLLMEVGGYENVFWEEFDLYVRYLSRTKLEPCHIDEPLYTYTIREGSMTSQRPRVDAGWAELLDRWPMATLERFGHVPDAEARKAQRLLTSETGASGRDR